MENPLELPPPDDPIQQIHALARGLAYGAANRIWGATFLIDPNDEDWWDFSSGSDQFNEYLGKWGHSRPPADLMISFGYFSILQWKQHGSYDCLLTPKAFALLEKPISPPSVFISYKRDESSALGLLIESRLKLVDSHIGVFIDKLLEPGDKWHAQLEEKVRQSRYFVCLLAPKSLGSKYVRNEIRWALDAAETGDAIIIPVCHNGYRIGDKLPEELQENADEIEPLLDRLSANNAVTIYPESAEEYELAIIKLLNKLGYSNV